MFDVSSETISSLSDVDHVVQAGATSAVRLPWGPVRERVPFPESVPLSANAKPGVFALQMLFADFTVLAEKKIEQVLEAQVDRDRQRTR